MMPFSVLRIWGLGLLSWALLGFGVYFAWQSYDEFGRARTQETQRESAISEPGDAETNAAETESAVDESIRVQQPGVTKQRAWSYAVAAGILLAISFGGALPVRLILGGSPAKAAEPIPPAKQVHVDRPDGSRLHVEVYGEQNEPTLLLTHGWSLDASAWDYSKRQLSQRYRIVVWDLPGLGRSKGPNNRDFSLEKMAHDLDAVIRATATRAPIVLVSHSMGGMLTQVFCRLHPEHLGQTVHGLAMIHTTYTNPLRTCFAPGLATALEAPLITPLNYLTIALAPLAWLSNWQSYLNGSLHLMTRFASMSGKQSWQQLDHGALLAAKAWPGVVCRGNLAMQRFNEERTLPRLELPVLVLAAEHDRMTLPAASEHMERLLPNDRPQRIDAGHLSFFEQAEQFVEIVSEFVDHVVPPKRSTSPSAAHAHVEKA